MQAASTLSGRASAHVLRVLSCGDEAANSGRVRTARFVSDQGRRIEVDVLPLWGGMPLPSSDGWVSLDLPTGPIAIRLRSVVP